MPLYVADYLADTGHLTVAEHGAYLLLLMHYWRVGSLPNDDRRLAVMASCSTKQWRQVRDVVLAFFQRDGDRLVHKRVEEEMTKAGRKAEARKTRARAGAAARWGNASGADPAPEPAPAPKMGPLSGHDSGAANSPDHEAQAIEKAHAEHATVTYHHQSRRENVSKTPLFPPKSHTRARARAASAPEPGLFGEASTSPDPEAREAPPAPPPAAPSPPPAPPPIVPEPGGNIVAFAPRAVAIREPAGFDEFWRLYPRKTSKGAARTAWEKACRKARPAEIIDALRERLAHFPDEARFVPHPATWLNQERWSDEIASLRAVQSSRAVSAAEESFFASGGRPEDLEAFMQPARRTTHGE